MRRGAWGAAALLLFSACAAPPKDAAPETPPFPVEGADPQLLFEARRELEAFAEHGQRPADAADAAAMMRTRLEEQGYAHARVEFEIEPERLVFRVQRGPRAYLRWVAFEGATAVSESELSRPFEFEGAGPLGAGAPYFVLAQIEAAVASVEQIYLLRGFYRVRAAVARVEWNEDRTEADVTVRIEEGIPYRIASVEIEGLGAEDAEPLREELVGRPYEARVPIQTAARIRRLLLDRGNLRCEVDGDAQVDDETGLVVLRLWVTEGPQVRLGEVRFEGNERTRTRFLRRRAALKADELLTQDDLDRATTDLYRTGLFTSVRPRLIDAADDSSDVLFDLKESLARSIDLEVGYGSYELVRGAARLTDRNFLGRGRTFTAEINGCVRGGGADIDVTDPYLLGPKNVLQVGTGFLYREEPSFDLQSFHANLLVKREISKKWSATGGYSFRDERATNVKVPIDEEAEGFIRTAGLVFGVTRDTRDSTFLPTTGMLWQAGTLWSSPSLGADLDFIELDTQVAKFFRLGPGTVLGITGRFRARHILDDRADLPIQQRYFLGGATTVRSFYEDELGPTESGSPRGGLTAVEAGAELRQRIRGELYGAAFFDYGTLDVEGFSVHAPPGFAVGLGARYYLPVGPIRFDVGYNPGQLFAADARWAFQLAFGFSF